MHSFWLLFVIKLYSHINTFKVIRKKHGKYIYTLVKSFEKIKTNYMKTILDIKFNKQCKQEQLIPTFAMSVYLRKDPTSKRNTALHVL